MRTTKILAPATLLAMTFQGCSKPDNIIFFLVDDYGWPETSVPFGEEVYPRNLMFETPNMQRLADKGVIMTRAYACPVSTPTRASIMTGMNAAASRITTWTSFYKDNPSDAGTGVNGRCVYGGTTRFGIPDWNWNGVCPEGMESPDLEHVQVATPLVTHLKGKGYYTVHVGKAHWASSGTPGSNPYNMGFDLNIAGSAAGSPRSYLGEDNYGQTYGKWSNYAVQNLCEYYGTDTFLSEALTREALKALDYPVSRHQPFYLYMAHYAVHTPIMPDMRFYDKYKAMGLDDKQAAYSSMVESVDKSLGDIMDYLDAKGIAKNTIIIFMSDNGGHAIDQAKGGETGTHNLPLRGGKGSCYEGGIRVPLMFYWPGKTAAGTRLSTPVSAEDMYPTLLEMAGIRNYSTVQHIDGQSLVRLITKGSQYQAKAIRKGEINTMREATRFPIPESVSGIDPNRPLVYHYPHQYKWYEVDWVDFMSTVMCGDWKLVYKMLSGTHELYNLTEDIGEQNDVSALYPQKVKELSAVLSDRLRGWNAAMPSDTLTGQRALYADEALEAGSVRAEATELR